MYFKWDSQSGAELIHKVFGNNLSREIGYGISFGPLGKLILEHNNILIAR